MCVMETQSKTFFCYRYLEAATYNDFNYEATANIYTRQDTMETMIPHLNLK